VKLALLIVMSAVHMCGTAPWAGHWVRKAVDWPTPRVRGKVKLTPIGFLRNPDSICPCWWPPVQFARQVTYTSMTDAGSPPVLLALTQMQLWQLGSEDFVMPAVTDSCSWLACSCTPALLT
jgi:hypothetical protein